MPGRKTPLVTDEIYHVFNRGINRQPTFITKWGFQRAVESIDFYRFNKPPASFSAFLRLDREKRTEMLKFLQTKNVLVEIFAFCLMPNHFHFLLKQRVDGGLSKFMSNFQNSYTRYFNTKHERDGSLFLDQFKAVRIEDDEQFLHVSRYIHLNPHTGYVVKTLGELEKYPWSSFPSYLDDNSNNFIKKDFLLAFFKTADKYKQFVFDQADYQRYLKKIQHLILE